MITVVAPPNKVNLHNYSMFDPYIEARRVSDTVGVDRNDVLVDSHNKRVQGRFGALSRVDWAICIEFCMLE